MQTTNDFDWRGRSGYESSCVTTLCFGEITHLGPRFRIDVGSYPIWQGQYSYQFAPQVQKRQLWPAWIARSLVFLKVLHHPHVGA